MRDLDPWVVRGVIVALGAALTATLVYGVSSPHGSYWTDVSVYFLGPLSEDESNAIAYTTDGVIATAGLVAHLVDPNSPDSPVSTKTPLLATGVREGEAVRLPNDGGQWEGSFQKPVLHVEVVGADAVSVGQRSEELVSHIAATLHRLQMGVAPRHRIRLRQTPEEVQVQYREGDPRRAMVAAGLLGYGLTTAAASQGGRTRHRWPPRSRRV